MILLGTIGFLILFLFVGWVIATDMFQHRAWRQKVGTGDVRYVAALVEDAMEGWRNTRSPKDTGAHLWAAVQGAELISIELDAATISTAAEGEFRTQGGRRTQVSSALQEAIAVAARLVEMMMYDVPNVQLATVRVDVYSTFTGSDGTAEQRPILTTTASRAAAETIDWEATNALDALEAFDTTYERAFGGTPVAIDLPPVSGDHPASLPALEEAMED